MPELLYSHVIEVSERVALKQKNCQLNQPCTIRTGVTGEEVSYRKKFDTTFFSETQCIYNYYR